MTFVIVKAVGGLTYCFALNPNPRMGKVIPEVGLQSEFGDMRDVQGYIDKCPIVASEISPQDRHHILQELLLLKLDLSTPDETSGKSSWKKTIGKQAMRLSLRSGNRPGGTRESSE